MAIVVQCKRCGKKLQAPDTFVGKRAKCTCGAVIEIPGAAAAPPPAAPQPTAPRPARKDLPKPEPKAAILPKSQKHVAAPTGDKHAPAAGSRAGAHAYGRRPRPKGGNKTVLVLMGIAAVAIVVGLVLATKYHTNKVANAAAAAAAAQQPQTAAKGAPQPVKPGPAIDPLTLVPADVKGVGFINLKQAAATGMLDSLAAALDAPAAGVDLQKNVETAAIAFDGDAFGSANAIIISGTFSKAAVLSKCVISKLRDSASVPFERDYHIRTTKNGSKAVTVIEERVLVFGTLAGVQKVINVYRGTQKRLAADSPLLVRSKALTGKAFWFTTDVLPSVITGIGGLDLSQVKNATASGTLADKALGVNVTLAFAPGPAAASVAGQLKELVQAFPTAATVLVGGDESTLAVFADAVKGLKVAAKGSDVAIDANLGADLTSRMKTLKMTLVVIAQGRLTTDMPAPPKLDEKETKRPKDDFDF